MFAFLRNASLTAKVVAAARRPALRYYSVRENLSPRAVDAPKAFVLENMIMRSQTFFNQVNRVSASEVERIIEVAEQQGGLTGVQSQIVLRMTGAPLHGLAPQQRMKLAEAVWELTPASELNIAHYNTLLSVRNQNNFEFDPADSFKQIKEKGLKPNRITFQRIIQRYCAMGDTNSAHKILQFMKDQDIAINERVFNCLIAGHFKAGSPESAEKVLDVMGSLNIVPSSETYTALALGYTEKGDIPAALKVIANRGLNDEQLFSIIFATLKAGRKGELETFFNLLPKHPRWTAELSNCCLDLIGIGKTEEGLLLFKRSVSIVQSFGHARPIGRSLLENGCSDEVMKSFISSIREVSEEGATDVMFHILRDALELQVTDKVSMVLTLLQADGHPAKPHYFYPLLAQAKNTAEFVECLQMMIKFGVDLNEAEQFFDFFFRNLDTTDYKRVVKFLSEHKLSNLEEPALLALLKKNILDGDFKTCIELMEKHDPKVKNFFTLSMGRQATSENLPQLLTLIKLMVKKAEARPAMFCVGTFLENLPSELLPETVKHINGSSLKVEDLVVSALKMEGLNAENIGQRDSPYSNFIPFKDLSVEELEDVAARMQSSNEAVPTRLQIQIVNKHLSAGNFDDAVKSYVKADVEQMTPAQLATGVSIFTRTGDVDKAMELFQRVEAFEDFRLDDSKLLRLASLLVEGKRLDESMKLVRKCSLMDEAIENRLLDYLRAIGAQHGWVEATELLIKELGGKLKPQFYAYLLNAILKEDFPKAFELFKRIGTELNIQPLRFQVLEKIIELNDPKLLQDYKTFMAPTQSQDRMTVDLAKVYSNLGEVEKAREYLRSVQYFYLVETVTNRLEWYLESKDDVKFDNFARSAEGINRALDVIVVEKRLLKAERENNGQVALDLWMGAQDEGLVLSDVSLYRLANLLGKNNIAVPFLVPEMRHKGSGETRTSGFIPAAISSAMQSNKLEEGFEAIRNLQLEEIHKFAMSIQRLFIKAAEQGRTDLFESLPMTFQNMEVSALTKFEKLWNESLYSAGRFTELLDRMEAEAQQNKVRLNGSTFAELVTKHPEFKERALKVAESLEHPGLFAKVFVAYTGNNDKKAAENLLKSQPNLIQYLPIDFFLEEGRKGNLEISKKFLDTTSTNELERLRAKGVYVRVRVLLNAGKIEEAHALMKEAMEKKNIPTRAFSRGFLEEFRKRIVEKGLDDPTAGVKEN